MDALVPVPSDSEESETSCDMAIAITEAMDSDPDFNDPLYLNIIEDPAAEAVPLCDIAIGYEDLIGFVDSRPPPRVNWDRIDGSVLDELLSRISNPPVPNTPDCDDEIAPAPPPTTPILPAEFLKMRASHTWLVYKSQSTGPTLGCSVCQRVYAMPDRPKNFKANAFTKSRIPYAKLGDGYTVRQHGDRKGHLHANDLIKQKERGRSLELHRLRVLTAPPPPSSQDDRLTADVFRLCNFIGRNVSFESYPKLLNVIDSLRDQPIPSLRSSDSCSRIVTLISEELRTSLFARVRDDPMRTPFSVLIDESTVGCHTYSVILLRCLLPSPSGADQTQSPAATVIPPGPDLVTNVILDLVPLAEDLSAAALAGAIRSALNSVGFTDDQIRGRLCAIVSDAASVMVGRVAGLRRQLESMLGSGKMNGYPPEKFSTDTRATLLDKVLFSSSAASLT
jgi:hypothetical protein